MPQPRSSATSFGWRSGAMYFSASLLPAASNSSGSRLLRIWSIASASSAGTRREPYGRPAEAGAAGPFPDAPRKRRTRLSSTSVRASGGDDRRDRLGQDRDVEPERPVLQVEEVQP